MDIRNQVIGEMQEMVLDVLVKFVEAKESGSKAGRYLDSGEAEVSKVTGYSSSQREQQLTDREKTGDEAKCRFCGMKGSLIPAAVKSLSLQVQSSPPLTVNFKEFFDTKIA